MKYKSFFTLLTLIIFFPCLICGEAVLPFDRSTNDYKPVDAGEIAVPVALPVFRQHSVLWDTTHGSYMDYNPLVGYATLISMLTDSGYMVQAFGGGVHTIDLHVYDIIVIALGSSWNSIYTQEEIDSLVSFYNDGNQRIVLTGDINFCDNDYINNASNPTFADNIFDWLGSSGGLFFMGDNSGCPNMTINPILNVLFMTAGLNTLVPSDLYFSNFAVHPIFNNVSQLYFKAAGQISASAPAAAVAWTSNNEPVVGALDQTLGIETTDNSPVQTLVIIPNPFTYYANIKGSGINEIEIYDVLGKLVEKTKSARIGDKLKPGVYFIKIDGGKLNKLVKIK